MKQVDFIYILCYYNIYVGANMKNKKRKLFCIADVIIIVAIILASAFAFFSQFNSSDAELCCVIRQNGEIVHNIYLENISQSQTVTVSSVDIRIEKNCVYVVSATCPDKLCENTGKISRSGQSIVCLPNKVSVTLESSSGDIDALTR